MFAFTTESYKLRITNGHQPVQQLHGFSVEGGYSGFLEPNLFCNCPNAFSRKEPRAYSSFVTKKNGNTTESMSLRGLEVYVQLFGRIRFNLLIRKYIFLHMLISSDFRWLVHCRNPVPVSGRQNQDCSLI